MKDLVSMKFGGTSMGDADSILKCVKAIKKEMKMSIVVVVASAVSGVTNFLYKMTNLVKKRSSRLIRDNLAQLERIHFEILEKLIGRAEAEFVWNSKFRMHFEEFKTILYACSLIGDINNKIKAKVYSYGEKFSNICLSEILTREGIENELIFAEEVIFTDKNYLEANVDFKKTTKLCQMKIKPLLENGIVPIVPGFTGQDESRDTTLLGRGGSDYTASILGSVLDAKRIDIYTDVNGIMSADPKMVESPVSWDKISAGVASELAYSGAKVIFPKSITCSIMKNIPMMVKNTFDESFEGTLVTNEKELGPKGIISEDDHFLINVKNPNMLGEIGFISEVTKLIVKHGMNIDVCATSETSFTFSTEGKMYSKELAKDLSKMSQVEVKKNISKLSIVGEGIVDDITLFDSIFNTLSEKKIQIHTISVGLSKNNITIMIDDKNRSLAIFELHERIFRKKI